MTTVALIHFHVSPAFQKRLIIFQYSNIQKKSAPHFFNSPDFVSNVLNNLYIPLLTIYDIFLINVSFNKIVFKNNLESPTEN
jgi:hypothetical protein